MQPSLIFYLIRFVLYSASIISEKGYVSSHSTLSCCHSKSLFLSSFFFFLGRFQLKICKGISYAAVAAHADKNGRRKLAAMLVEHEPRSSKQVFFFFFFFFASSILSLENVFQCGVPVVPICCFLLNILFQETNESRDIYGTKIIKVWCCYFDPCVQFLGSSTSKHWGRRYSSDKGNWKWWHWSCLPCVVSYLAEGITCMAFWGNNFVLVYFSWGN